MSVYGAASDGAYTFKTYQRQWVDVLLDNTKTPDGSADLQRQAILMQVANQNLAFANDVMGQILKNISSLQP